MTEIELKLTLLLYNMLSKERAKTAEICSHTCDYSKWADCIGEMKEMEDDLRRHGYEFVYAGFNIADEIQYSVYMIVLTNNYGFTSNV